LHEMDDEIAADKAAAAGDEYIHKKEDAPVDNCLNGEGDAGSGKSSWKKKPPW